MDAFIGKAKAYLDSKRGERVTLGELASAVGASPFHLQRRFKEAFGVSPRDYQDAHRVEAVKSSLQNGRRVADAVFDAGYGSVSRFYEKPLLGMNARDYRAKGKGQRISCCSFPSSLGSVLIAATDKGLCSVKLGDDARRLERLLAEDFSAAEIVTSDLKDLKAKSRPSRQGQASPARRPPHTRGPVLLRRRWEWPRGRPPGETRTCQQ